MVLVDYILIFYISEYILQMTVPIRLDTYICINITAVVSLVVVE